MRLNWWERAAAPIDEDAANAAMMRQAQLTKPPGSLGRLEAVAVRLAGMQGRECPSIDEVCIAIFAGDHGIAAEGVSAFPQSVTAEMVRNFARGGAAISVLSRSLAATMGATLEIVNLGTVVDPDIPGVVSVRLGPGTANFALEAAMTASQCSAALSAGRDAVNRATANALFVGGEMGIGNTTSATAIASVLLDMDPAQLAGPGTGLNAEGVGHKVSVLRRALSLHEGRFDHPVEVLRRLGGFEIAALCGAYIAAAQRGVPALVDGFISSVAAMVAVRLNASVRDWLLFAHSSAEPGHRYVLAALNAEPLLDLGMRLGEGSGAAVAVPLLRAACALHAGMATFAEAGVSDKPG
ncbi:MAG: nicotinate-nucleotide--dimethylbenzimidazole phosphoribosyltransferase [Gammaproteobacteria bacterium]|nr:nicotinate-nucleotide--dimethylbenzimidazole phosphoribosyltransferase [Gammaproteobacteria bacterium]MCP5135338.1 nicotinate-nucleotide--dimethylbenzimidazole phosphoribosyltransferase [Gammaproteobacteria bacterium]